MTHSAGVDVRATTRGIGDWTRRMAARRWLRLWGGVSVALPAVVTAQTLAETRPLGRAVAEAELRFGTIDQTIATGDGRVFVVDGTNRRVWLLDASLRNPTLVMDSASGRPNTFAPKSFLAPFRGDSVLAFDAAAMAFIVIDPRGQLGRTMAAPKGPDRVGLQFYVQEFGTPATSRGLGLVYKVFSPPRLPRVGADDPDLVLRGVDSMAVIRMDPDTRVTDTLVRLEAGRGQVRTIRAAGIVAASVRPMPFPFFDDAVVTSDGALAIFHAREYRVDWIGADGRRTTGTRLPFPWQLIRDADRARLLDSINGSKRRVYDSLVARRAADSVRTGSPPMTRAARTIDGMRVEREVPAPPPQLATLVAAEDIPDFLPPTAAHPILADADAHVWIRPTLPPALRTSGTVWDVIDRSGSRIDRVRIPAEDAVVGFAPGGFVLLARRAGTVTTLMKVLYR